MPRRWAAPFVVTVSMAPLACHPDVPPSVVEPQPASPDAPTTPVVQTSSPPPSASLSAAPLPPPRPTTTTATTASAASTPPVAGLNPIPPGARGRLRRDANGSCWFIINITPPPCPPGRPCPLPPNPPGPMQVLCPAPGTLPPGVVGDGDL